MTTLGNLNLYFTLLDFIFVWLILSKTRWTTLQGSHIDKYIDIDLVSRQAEQHVF